MFVFKIDILRCIKIIFKNIRETGRWNSFFVNSKKAANLLE